MSYPARGRAPRRDRCVPTCHAALPLGLTPILALLVSKMMFGVVEELPRLVRLLNLRPGARIGEAKVGEPPLDREQGFGVISRGSPASIRSLRIPSISSYSSVSIVRQDVVHFPSYLYADKTARYPASSGPPSSVSRLAKSSGSRLNVTTPSRRGHWLGCRSQANSIPLKSGSCR